MAGRVIAGRYILEAPIGHGGMGRVWRAHDQLLNRKVAIKEVLLPVPMDEGEAAAYKRTQREAQTVARLNHPNIVSIYDVAEEDGRLWIVMELVPSGSLEERLAAHGPMTALRTARLGQQLLSALAAVHAAGVLHRDVKPNNVLIAPGGPGDGADDRAVLTDFGIARSEGDTRITQANMVMGSAGYTAPERLNGHDATSASDLWSLGATLYAAVEGQGPYQRDSMSSTLAANAHEAAPPAPSAGRLAPLIEALLRREPYTRPSAAVAARILAEILRQMPDETAPASFVAVTSLDPIPTESALHEIAEPAEWAVTEQHETLLPAPAWPPPPDDTELPVLPAPVASTPLSSPTQTSTLPPLRVPAQPSPPTSASPATPPEPSQAAGDLLQQFASDTGRGARRSRRSPRRVRKGTLITACSVGAAAVAAAVLISAHYESGPKKAGSASASKSISPTASDSATTSASGLPPTPGAPAVVEAIDNISRRLPPGYKTQQMPATVAGATAGFSIDTPQNWLMHAMGQQTYQYTPAGPDDGVTYVEIDLAEDTKSNMVSEAEYLAAPDRRKVLYPGYERIYGSHGQKKYIQPEIIRGTSGALWEFDYVSNGTTMRMDVLLFTLENQSYTIYTTGPAGRDDRNWNSNILMIVDKMLPTFKQLPA
jgi:serine/threonine protein kinase